MNDLLLFLQLLLVLLLHIIVVLFLLERRRPLGREGRRPGGRGPRSVRKQLPLRADPVKNAPPEQVQVQLDEARRALPPRLACRDAQLQLAESLLHGGLRRGAGVPAACPARQQRAACLIQLHLRLFGRRVLHRICVERQLLAYAACAAATGSAPSAAQWSASLEEEDDDDGVEEEEQQAAEGE